MRIAFTLIVSLFILSCKVKSQNASYGINDQWYGILPEPLSQKPVDGQFVISRKTKLEGDVRLKESGEYLSEILTSATGHRFSFISDVRAEKSNTISLIIDNSITGEESYRLSVTPNSIVVTGKNESGVFYGIQSLRQLFPPDAEGSKLKKPSFLPIACTEIEDAPRFAWRGMMLDLSRHFIGVEEIKKLMNSMAAHKLNRLHLHLSDNPGWRIEIKEYPKLTTVGAIGNYSDADAPAQFLTEAQGRELAEYARRRFIIIVPEIDMPGHSSAIVRAYPELDGGETTLNVAAPAIEKFVDVIVSRVTDIFSTKYFHFGSDEVFKTNWVNVPETKLKMAELGFKEPHELEGWFDRRTAKQILDKNLQPIAWDEASAFGVDRRTIVQWWRGIQPETLAQSLKLGHQVIISPVNYIYFDYPYNRKEFGAEWWQGMVNGGNSTELVYNWEPLPSTITGELRSKVLGIEACVWTEFINSDKRLEYMIFPRISAFSEVAWSSEENKNWNKFRQKLDTHVKRLDAQGVNFRKLDIPEKDRAVLQPEGFSNKSNIK